MLRRLNKRRLARLKADILLLDKRMAEIVASNANLARRYDLLTSMRGTMGANPGVEMVAGRGPSE